MTLKLKPFVVCILFVFGFLSAIDQALGSTASARKSTHLVSRRIQQHIPNLEDMTPKVLKDCYYPKASRAVAVIEELNNQCPKAVRVSLQGKNLLFSNPSTKAMFDPTVVHDFSLALPKTLRVLDLSLNRFPLELLTSIYPLLQRPNFRFLDVRTNAGADSLEAMQQLANLHARTHNLPDILRKVIWVQEGYFAEASFLPQTYKKAHKSYYLNEYDSPESPQWKLPE